MHYVPLHQKQEGNITDLMTIHTVSNVVNNRDMHSKRERIRSLFTLTYKFLLQCGSKLRLIVKFLKWNKVLTESNGLAYSST
jgi:hypothetical protein